MKWDLVVTSLDESNLCITDFHLSPISEYLDFQYNQDSDLLNYKHLENVKRLYGRLKGDFFKNSYNPKLDTLYPTHFESYTPPFEDTYHGGVKRMSYKRYSTQFQALCPLWLENFDPKKHDINIYIKIFTFDNDQKKSIVTKKLCLTSCRGDKDYHTRFSNYLNEYLELISLDENTCSIDFSKNEAWIKGVNVEKGVLETKDTSYTLANLLDRERPLIEFNSMLTHQFTSNKMITRQLFNFNICFNIYDIIPIILIDSVFDSGSGPQVNIEVVSEVANKPGEGENAPEVQLLPFKDFFTNHEYISRLRLGDGEDNETYNCLEYLQDNKCIDFIDKNKISPQICHWSLLDNNEYVFQLYDGFAPVYKDSNGKMIKTSHRYYDMPDVWSSQSTAINNAYGWCNVIWNTRTRVFNDPSQVALVDGYRDRLKYTEFKLDGSSFYAQSLKYSGMTATNNSDSIFVCIVVLDKDYGEPFNGLTELTEGILYHIDSDNYLTILVRAENQQDSLEFLGYKNFIQQAYEEATFARLQGVLKTLIKPKIIFFDRGLDVLTTNRPDTPQNNSDIEIEYQKNDKKQQYVIRYDGKIRPCMISQDNSLYHNYLYYKLSSNTEELDIYNKYAQTNFAPLYPSIGYFAIKHTDKINYDKPQIFPIWNDLEYHWYNSSNIMPLKTTLKLQHKSGQDTTPEMLVDFVKNELTRIYNLE